MTVLDKLKETLEGIDIRFNEPLKTYTYTKVGGKADDFLFEVFLIQSLLLDSEQLVRTYFLASFQTSLDFVTLYPFFSCLAMLYSSKISSNRVNVALSYVCY